MNRGLFQKIFLLLVALVFCYGVAWTGSYFTQSSVNLWYADLNKPSFNPPNVVFPVVWMILYTLIALSFWRILCNPKACRIKVLAPFFIQMFLNFLWSMSFFYLESPLLGLINIIFLDIAILWNICAFFRYSKLASILLLPYFAWVLFATFLNFIIFSMN